MPPREHKKVNYAEFETFSDNSSENNKKQNHGNYISWSSSEDAILVEQIKKFMESQKNANVSNNNENENNNISRNLPTITTDNNEYNLNLNKEKNLSENTNNIKIDEKEENKTNINNLNDTLDQKINPLTNINWSKIAEKLENKNARQCQTRWQNILDPNRVKGPWTKEEDMKLIELVKKFGPEKWSNISSYLPGRLGKQCRERWYNHLNPEVRKTGWSKEEEWMLFLLHRKYGNSWSIFSEKIPGRTDNTIKNHWNSIMKKNIVGINNQYQEMTKGKTKEEIEEIEKNIIDKCSQTIYKDYNEYYQEKLKAFPMMKLSKHAKKEKENKNNLNTNENNNNKSNDTKNNSLDNIINNIDIKTPTKSKKKIFENIKINARRSSLTKSKSKSKSKNKNKINEKNEKKEEIYEKNQKKLENKEKEKKKKNNTKKANKYLNIEDDKELKILKSGEKILQKDKNILIKEAENKFREKQKKINKNKSKSISNIHNKNEEDEESKKKSEKLNAFSNKKTAKKSKKKASHNKSANNKKRKNKFNVSKLSNRKEKESPKGNNLNNIKLNLNNNFINNSNNNTNNMNSGFNDYLCNNNNINIPYPTYPMEKLPYYMDEEKDYSKNIFNKILISDSKDINKSKKEQQFPFRIPTTAPFYRSDIKNSSESSGGNNSLGKIVPEFRMNPPFMSSNDKFYLFNNPQNMHQNRNMFVNTNPKMFRFAVGGENNNNKISTDSNSIHSYSIKSMLSANSAFKKSSSGSGSGSGRSFQPRVAAFNFNNMADLNKEYFSNITLDEKNLNNKM